MTKGNRKFIATAATAALVASAIAPAASAAAKDFTDVPDRYKDAVDFLVEKGAKGVSATSFGTNQSIKRVDAAVFVANVLGLDTDNAPASGFTDVPDRAAGAVNALKAAGITSGKTATSFGSSSEITRGELAIWLQRGFKLKGSADSAFTDISDRYAKAVEALVANEITNGVSATKYGVGQQAKRGDFAIFLHKADAVKPAFELSLMHTNDQHGNAQNAPKLATAVKEFRAANPEALLLDAGDVFSGTLYFNEFEGQADLQFMNYLEYDAMTFGNHEFDLGSSEDGHKALAEFVKAAKFPFVTANVDFSKDSLFDGLVEGTVAADAEDGKIYNAIIQEVDGEKVGIFGLTTSETAEISSPGQVEFKNYIEEAKASVKALQEQGVNKIIVLTHIGYDDNIEFDNDLELAKQVDGIDIIVGGHTHTKLEEAVVISENKTEPTVIVQANEYNKYLGTLSVNFDSEGVVTTLDGELVDLGEVAEDAEAVKILKPYKETIDAMQQESIGVETAVALDGERANVRTVETNLGNLITDGMLKKAQSINPNTVIALTNGGGIRASIDQGDITLGEILTVMPFGNALGIMQLTGEEIVEALEHSVSQAPEQNGGFLQVSGLKFSYDSSEPAGERVVSVEVKGTDGNFAELAADQTYAVATNTFTAKGGDGYDVFAKAYADGRVSEPGFVDFQVFTDYLTGFETIEPVIEGRITDLSAE
ncbi:5'-nucleotidase C-terminal domain-containing protein [Cytobacillus gottheilii]|uniref:5'-nucleotidase C-terminal domain-containing protein n=1 Tax=Cytobacillus gottheilii TaxID=859144 RepID=A0ABX8FA26_9BACI|nr:5'-nucleotidase C-terminal domain-containing protein [Cytobacillus gottheilii]QVY61235.1 5'-nucleotidase C-terminal domain-containing protein [Cytobacillus gottheilii]